MQHGSGLPCPHNLGAGTAAASLAPHTLQPPGYTVLPVLDHPPASQTRDRGCATHDVASLDVASRDVAQVLARRQSSKGRAHEGSAAQPRRARAAPAQPAPSLILGTAAKSTEPSGSQFPRTAPQPKGASDSSESMSDGDEEYRPPSPTKAAANARTDAESEPLVGRTTRARRATSAIDRHITKVPWSISRVVSSPAAPFVRL